MCAGKCFQPTTVHMETMSEFSKWHFVSTRPAKQNESKGGILTSDVEDGSQHIVLVADQSNPFIKPCDMRIAQVRPVKNRKHVDEENDRHQMPV